MSFFENLGATLGSGAKNALDKGKELKDVAALKTQISTAQASLGKMYKELGKAYFEDHKDSGDYAEITDKIKEVLDKVADLEKKLSDTQGVLKCNACGATLTKGSAFCPKCGEPIDTYAEEDTDEGKDIPIE